MLKIIHIAGARPNFMKVAPVMAAMGEYPEEFEQMLVHTGQHYDENMSAVFFDDLELPKPDINLGVGSGSHEEQIAKVMTALEPVLLEQKPDWVFVYGDINSTVAAALTCEKLSIKVAHVEAGLRSFDSTMPEEGNRIQTDRIADLLLSPSSDADENLKREGIPEDRIHLVGNVMIDTLVRLLPRAEGLFENVRGRLDLPESYALVTLHRPGNVDDPEVLSRILSALDQLSSEIAVLFPVHPRTRAGISRVVGRESLVQMLEPLRYLDFLALQTRASAVITDSGGIQEESTYLGVPCVTIRPNTERPITIEKGTNRLCASDTATIVSTCREALTEARLGPDSSRIPLWDGKAAQRIVTTLRGMLNE